MVVYNYFDNNTNEERTRAEASTSHKSVIFDNFSLRRWALSWYSWIKPDFVSENCLRPTTSEFISYWHKLYFIRSLFHMTTKGARYRLGHCRDWRATDWRVWPSPVGTKGESKLVWSRNFNFFPALDVMINVANVSSPSIMESGRRAVFCSRCASGTQPGKSTIEYSVMKSFLTNNYILNV